jgi:Arc/MetJ family transcription regulator
MGLTPPGSECIHICMRTTLILRDELIKKAAKLTGIEEKTALLHAGLEALIARESARRLAALGGTEPKLEGPRRRRSGEHS